MRQQAALPKLTKEILNMTNSMIDVLKPVTPDMIKKAKAAIDDANEAGGDAFEKGTNPHVKKAVEAVSGIIENATGDKKVARRVRVRKEKKETLPTETKQRRVTVAAQPEVDTLYRMEAPPSAGRPLFTYTVGILMALGAFTPARKSFSKDQFGAFYRTKTALRHHTKTGNLEEVKGDKVRLSVAGWNYMHGRITGSTVAQKVLEPEAKALAEAFKTGKLETSTDWFKANTKFVPIKG